MSEHLPAQGVFRRNNKEDAMTYNPTPEGPRGGRPGGNWGATGLFIVGLVIVLALLVTLLGPTNTQQASNVPASPPPNSQPEQPQPAQ